MNVAGDVEITGLHIYPIKSCGGVALREAALARRGLLWDREWMIVDGDGLFVTQRQLPRMALIRVSLEARNLRVKAPGLSDFLIPLVLREMPETAVKVWRHETMALDEGAGAAAWFSEFLGRPVRLVRWNHERRRLCNREYTGEIEAETGFADGYPILVSTEESLADLNQRIGGESPLPMDRFRSNVILRGGAPYAEDVWRSVAGEGVELRLVKPCTRCPITATDQTTTVVGKEPLTALAAYRRHERLNGVVFSQNAVVTSGFGKFLRVGMHLAAS
jgi:uncharacterized protein